MISNLRRVAGTAVIACLLAASAIGPGGVARATTGPSANLAPTYKVSSKFGQQFVGQYIMASVPAAAHLRSAAFGVEVNNNGFLYGIGSGTLLMGRIKGQMGECDAQFGM